MKIKRHVRHLMVLVFMMVISSCALFPTSSEKDSLPIASSSSETFSSANESSEELSTSEVPSSESEVQSSEPEPSSKELSSSEEPSISVELEMKRSTYTNSVYFYDFPDPSGVYDPIQHVVFICNRWPIFRRAMA